MTFNAAQAALGSDFAPPQTGKSLPNCRGNATVSLHLDGQRSTVRLEVKRLRDGLFLYARWDTYVPDGDGWRRVQHSKEIAPVAVLPQPGRGRGGPVRKRWTIMPPARSKYYRAAAAVREQILR